MPRTKKSSPKRLAKARTKQQIIAALRSVARKLDHPPTSVELYLLTGISRSQVAWRFHGYRAAVRAAGLEPENNGVRIETAALLQDWGNVLRKVDAVPSGREYEQAGRYSRFAFYERFKGWTAIPAAFCKSVAAGARTGDWTDVLEIIRRSPIPTTGGCKGLAKMRETMKRAHALRLQGPVAATEAPVDATEGPPAQSRQPAVNTATGQLLPPPLWGRKCVTATMLAVFVAELAPSGLQWVTAACFPRRPLNDRPLLGAPTKLRAFPFEPVNEMGVMVLFSMLAERLGFVVESVQAAFPDCQAKIEVEPGRWQHFRIEFEYESRSFKLHDHDAGKCDLIVCWRHNWKNCPPNLQVLELSRIVAEMAKPSRG
jgi:Homing endonuclease associated repeat